MRISDVSEQGSNVWAFGPSRASSDLVSRSTRLCFLFTCLFVIAIYLRPEDIVPSVAKFHLTLVIGVCVATTFLWSVFNGEVSLSWPRELWVMLLITAWFIAGIPFAFWKGGSFDVLTHTWLKTLLLFWVLTQTLVSLSRIRRVLWCIILSELVVTAYSLAAPESETTWKGAVGDRLSGINHGFLYWNLYGIALAITIPFMAALFISRRSALKSTILAVTVALASWMQVLTASRSGTLDVGLAVLLTWWFVCRDTTRGRAIAVGIGAAVVAAVLLAPKVFWSRMSTLSGDDYANNIALSAEASTAERRDVLTRSLNYTFEHPLFGLGLGNFEPASAADHGGADVWVAPHNTFTEISSEAGIPALLLFLGLFASVLVSMRRVGQKTVVESDGFESNLMARAALASTLSLVFGIMFANISYEYFLYACPVAIAVGIQRAAAGRSPSVNTAKITGSPRELRPEIEGWWNRPGLDRENAVVKSATPV